MLRTEAPAEEERLVRIITLVDGEFDEVAEMADEKLIAHLARWDYGDENDGAATVNGYVSVPEAERFGAEAVEHGGLEYWIAVDRNLRMTSLLRRPLPAAVIKTNAEVGA